MARRLSRNAWSRRAAHASSIRRTLGLLAIATLVASACDGGGDPGPSPLMSPAPAAGAGQADTLECETVGYPCSLAEVEPEILERSSLLAHDALDVIAAGGTTDEAAALLGEHGDVAEIEWDETALRFRLEGGRGMWVLTAEQLSGLGDATSGLGPPVARGVQASMRRPIDDAPDLGGPTDIIAKPDRDAKEAIVLSAFQWQFSQLLGGDEGRRIADVLSVTRGYEGGVRYEENAAPDATDVDVEDFGSWSDASVIHVSTHGVRLCPKDSGGPCRATIAARHFDTDTEDPSRLPESVTLLTWKGVEVALTESGCAVGRGLELCFPTAGLVLLGADFFRDAYPGGLEDAFVFLNACETFGPEATDLAGALMGTSSVYLGWTESVGSANAVDAADRLYGALATRGYPAERAFQRVPTYPGEPAQLVIGKRRAGGDVRIREIVTQLDHESGAPLGGSGMVAFEELGDGVDDVVPWRVRVDGITDDVAGGTQLHVSIDGIEIDPVALDSVAADEIDRRELSGVVELGYDLEESLDVPYEAWVELPDQGRSDEEATLALVGPGPVTGRVWQLDFERVVYPRIGGTDPFETSGTIVFEYDPDAYQGPGRLIYRPIGGRVTHDEGHVDQLCIVEAPLISMEVTPEIVEFSELVFDVREEPFLVTVRASIDLPDFTSTVSCRPGSGEMAGDYSEPEEQDERGVLHPIGLVGDDRPTMMPDQTTLSGVDGEATYTLTRIE